MQLKTLPETPAQAKPALETTEGKQEDMLACHLDLHRVTEPSLSLYESEDDESLSVSGHNGSLFIFLKISTLMLGT